MKGRSVHLLFAALILVPSTALANGYLVPGTMRYGVSVYDDWDNPDTVSIPAVVDNSYYCRSNVFSGVNFLDFSSSITGPSSTSPTVTLRGNADGLGNEEGAFAFVAQATGAHSMAIASTSSGTGGSSSAQAILECFNTTLFGGFNTVTIANPVNFLEITNLSTVSVDALIVVKGFNGSEIARTTKTLAAGTRQDVGIHELSGASNTFGSVTVAHNGPLGGLTANVSKYTFNNNVLAITATEPLRERVQR